jgi:hypothetical protein
VQVGRYPPYPFMFERDNHCLVLRCHLYSAGMTDSWRQAAKAYIANPLWHPSFFESLYRSLAPRSMMTRPKCETNAGNQPTVIFFYFFLCFEPVFQHVLFELHDSLICSLPSETAERIFSEVTSGSRNTASLLI